ncbi:MAG: hypothetical protein NT065_02320 [Chlamydiae bacterium]|nr:hypothetical protein [Chlamydiota bacterium]
MRRVSYTPYVLLLIFLLLVLSLPDRFTRGLRSLIVYTVSPSWQGLDYVKTASLNILTLPTVRDVGGYHPQESADSFQKEHDLLTTQIENLRTWLLMEDRIEEQLIRLKELKGQSSSDSQLQSFFQRRAREISKILELELCSCPAKVIFREPASWSSFVWINIGEKQNKVLGKTVIAKNSPVLLDGALIGVVEDVRNAQAKVRLITDARLHVAVRIARGRDQNQQLWQQLQSMLYMLENRNDLFQSVEEQQAFMSFFNRIKSRITASCQDRYLAKGQLHGGSAPLWRSRSSVLYGIGFNYDWPDQEGPSRDLRSGRPSIDMSMSDPIALLKQGDLLVTSGLDGVFPPGLPVAVVKTVTPLREGASSYDIVAEAVAVNLSDVSTVLVLPPVEFDPS